MRVMRERPPPSIFVNTSQPMLSLCAAVEEGGEKKKKDAAVPLSASTNSDGVVIYISRPLLPLQAS